MRIDGVGRIASPDLYTCFPVEIAGLKSPFIALLDRLRVLDVNQNRQVLGSLTTKQ